MSNQDLQTGETEEETHIITERIIEEPSDEENEDLFEEYVIKGAAFTLGVLMIMGMTAALISDTLLIVLSSSLLSLGILVAVFALTEEE